MELLKDTYLINYIENASEFRINVLNKINSRKYQVIKTVEDYKIYADIGIDIFKIITQSFCDGTYEINDLTHKLIITFVSGIVKINVELSNIISHGDDISVLSLKIKLKDMEEHIAKQDIEIVELKEGRVKLKIKNKELKDEIVELKKNVAQLKERDYSITIREGFRTLEQIMREIAGSKQKSVNPYSCYQ
jgi:hypothetical protein